MTRILAILLLAIPATACTVGEVGTPPPAPTELAAKPVSGGLHLTWKDNSEDEMHFMVMRMMHGHGDSTMQAVATLGENTTEYHDANIESGMTYMYEVAAMNDSGESDSNQVEIAAP